MLKIIPIPALQDNYIWMIINQKNKTCVVVDPGDETPVLDYLKTHALRLAAILITHHHWDHTGGILALQKQHPCDTFGPAHIAGIDHPIQENESFELKTLGLTLTPFSIPGHTLDHMAYYGNNLLFCGDTLFAAGCGRVFEGTHEQMHHALMKLAKLPDETAVYCAHEYTVSNLKFAQRVDPTNTAIKKRLAEAQALQKKGTPTLPSTLKLEKATNPFLRCKEQTIKLAAEKHAGKTLDTQADIFRVIRQWKDHFTA